MNEQVAGNTETSFICCLFAKHISGNGVIELDEFIALMTKQCTQVATEKDIREAFKVNTLVGLRWA